MFSAISVTPELARTQLLGETAFDSAFESASGYDSSRFRAYVVPQFGLGGDGESGIEVPAVAGGRGRPASSKGRGRVVADGGQE